VETRDQEGSLSDKMHSLDDWTVQVGQKNDRIIIILVLREVLQ